MEQGEISKLAVALLPVASPYQWEAGRIHNLKDDRFIADPKGGMRTRLSCLCARDRLGDQPRGC